MGGFWSEQSIDVYKSIIDYNTDAIFILSAEGKVMDVNLGVTKTFGYLKEEILGMPYEKFILPAQIDEVNQYFDKVLQGIPCEFKTEAVDKHGRLVYVQVKNVPLLTGEEVVGVFGVAIDITEQLRLEKALMESEERYRKLLEVLPEGILVCEEGEIVYANSSAGEYAGNGDLIGKSISSLIHPDDRERLEQLAAGTKKDQGPSYVELRMNRNDGTTTYVDLGTVSVTQGDTPVILAMIRDITAQRLVVDALKESEERYRLLAENSLDLIQLVNLDGIVTFASPSHKMVLGYGPQEYIGKWVFYRPDKGDDPEFQLIFFDMVVSQKPFTYEIVRRHKEGHQVWVELKGSPMFDEEGHFKNMMLVGREITERKKYQGQLEHLSFKDTLTGVPNRRHFSAAIERILKSGEPPAGNLAVMFLDLDKFKRINDTWGHDTGDELLRQFAIRIKQCIKNNDILARIGGDEFVVVLPDLESVEQAVTCAEEILHALRQPWNILGHEFVTTSSIGIAFYEPGDREKELIHKADTALYLAKSQGKNTYRVYA
ncbi:PAS domain S-box-containing protein/diguanylate cyclase (GGDEF)-like protein [Fontibacillus phaseoli]|uniref:PAS domain S-box-containing protein/diguanylate cyclase (GGDEF)-like protein n=1 Tax=Fontibacillus phaseoli TaxID=1416533 RepID=A0A369BEF0_9BACL|nr:PAS domain S-box protein [Fontibacillus phaseoli]RCX19605.1 PAS domain S-box-containing protein/diguanylate cyclase (GGDEF)-like protein [Fontibacillus phaseoli]